MGHEARLRSITDSPLQHDEPARGEAALVRVQCLLGLGLIAYLAVHVSDHWSALQGLDAWVAAHGRARPGWTWLRTLPFVVYAGLGLALSVRSRAARGTLSSARLLTGGLAFACLLAHVAQIFPDEPGPQRSAFAAYQRLVDTAGLPLCVVGGALGLSALCLHAALGIEWAVTCLRGAPVSRRALAGLRYVVGALSFCAWGALLHLFGHFAIGDALVPTGQTLDTISPRSGGPIELSAPE